MLLLVEKGVDHDVAKEQIVRIDGYLTQTGSETVDVSPEEMANGIVDMLKLNEQGNNGDAVVVVDEPDAVVGVSSEIEVDTDFGNDSETEGESEFDSDVFAETDHNEIVTEAAEEAQTPPEVVVDFPFGTGTDQGNVPEAAMSVEEEINFALAGLEEDEPRTAVDAVCENGDAGAEDDGRISPDDGDSAYIAEQSIPDESFDYEKANGDDDLLQDLTQNIMPESTTDEVDDRNEDDVNGNGEENSEDDPADDDEDADMRIAPVPGAGRRSSDGKQQYKEGEHEENVAPDPDDYSDDKIDRYSPGGRRGRDKQIDKDHGGKDVDYQNLPNKTLFWILFWVTLPLAVIVGVAAAIIYIGLWITLAVLMAVCIAGLVAFVAAGTMVSTVGIVYGAIQIIKGIVPIGLYEIGLGVIVGAIVLCVGILVYNFAIRFIPFAMKQLTRLLKFAYRRGHAGIVALKGVCERL